jgi:glyceraldehyde-3-phosphate dehydrogenase/erythrose-4-phosphate dehydrogenase
LYGFGANETLVGKVLKSHRQKFTLASKCGMTGVDVNGDGKLVRVLSWYDNEWGFSNRMVDTAAVMAGLL